MFFHKAKAERVGRIWERVWGERSSIKKLSNFLFAYKNYIFHSNKWVRDCERWWRMGCTRLNPWIRPKKKRVENHSTCAIRRRERKGTIRLRWEIEWRKNLENGFSSFSTRPHSPPLLLIVVVVVSHCFNFQPELWSSEHHFLVWWIFNYSFKFFIKSFRRNFSTGARPQRHFFRFFSLQVSSDRSRRWKKSGTQSSVRQNRETFCFD